MYGHTRQEGFGKEVKRRIILGTYVLSAGYYDAYYRKASQVRTLMRADFEQAYQEVDVIVTPVAPTPAFELAKRWKIPSRCTCQISSRFQSISQGFRRLHSLVVSTTKGCPSGCRSWGNISTKERCSRRLRLRAEHRLSPQRTGPNRLMRWATLSPSIRHSFLADGSGFPMATAPKWEPRGVPCTIMP